MKARFLSIIGLFPKRDTIYALPEEGRSVAEVLQRGEDVGE